MVVSADGTIVTPSTTVAAGARDASPAAKEITTAEGVWTFGTPANASGDYPILLNGSNANGGRAALLQVTNGHLYAQQKAGQYWVRYSAAWTAAGAPVEGTQATAITLAVALPRIPDNSPAGTVIAKANVTMSPAGAKFTGPLVSGNPLFKANGVNIVLSRALQPTDDGAPFNTVITAVQ
jgi:hypothetical protein